MGGVFLRIAPVRVSECFPTSSFDGMALKTSTIIVLFLCEILTFIVASIQFSQFSLTLLLFFCQLLVTSCGMYVEILREIWSYRY